jgi:hypothetical protein
MKLQQKLPNLGKGMDIQKQETYIAPNRHDQKRTSPHNITVKMLRLENKERVLKAT